MTNILRIDASSRIEDSYSRQLGDVVEQSLKSQLPNANVVHRDLAAAPLEHIRKITIAGFYTPAEKLTDELRQATSLSDDVIAEVKNAEILLITTPMYNFSIPSALKAWIDQLVRIGHTFSYDGSAFTGLLPGRKAYVVVAYGAPGYTNSGPFAAADFVTPYLRFLLQFLGISDVTFFTAEGTTGDSESVTRELDMAKLAIKTNIQR